MKRIDINSPAKINLDLKIFEKNDYGYHNIETSFQYIDLFDHMTFEVSERGISIQSNKSFLENKDNTIYKSAKSLIHLTNSKKGINITIEKNIPVGAGLGGGSSNAASTIIALNKLWGLNLTKNKLMDIAKEIGADVPFFIHGENAYGSGIGDKLKSKLPIKDKILLIYPKINNSSSEMYHLLDIQRGDNIEKSHHKQNDFWNVFLDKNNEINEFYELISSEYNINLSGSGSSMFILYKKDNEIKEILKKIPSNWRFFFCKPLQYSPICYIK